MNHKISAAVLALSAAATAGAAAATTAARPASANVSPVPANAGCPTAFQLLSVSALEATGPYIDPRIVDQAGNDNGLVCGFPLPPGRAKADCQTGGTVACHLGDRDELLQRRPPVCRPNLVRAQPPARPPQCQGRRQLSGRVELPFPQAVEVP